MTLEDLAPITIKGYKFFDSASKQEILIKGVDYYPAPNHGDLDQNNIDFFTEEYRHIWERDIQQFQELGLNAIRLYSVDPDKDHSAFMCAMNAAGIYVMVGLATGKEPKNAILSTKAPACYPTRLKTRGEKIIREFSKYSNTLAFSAGNEVNHYVEPGKSPAWNAPCLKKFVQDMRAYMHRCDSLRHVPVGLIMADTDRDDNTLYYNCQSGHDHLDHAEWYGINTYVYCNANHTTYDQASGFKSLTKSFKSYNYSIPVLLTEFGCLSTSFPTIDGVKAQRSFNQAKWLGLPEVQKYFGGGFVFEYSNELANANNFGIGNFTPDLCDDIEVPCEYNRMPEFYNLKKAYADASTSAEHLTMDEFEPDTWRVGRTKCPPHFPALHSFLWKTDLKPSIQCPSASEMDFKCTAGGVPSPASSPAQVMNKSAGHQDSFPARFLVVITIVGIFHVFIRFLSGLRSPTIQIETPNDSEWKPGRDIDDDVTSEESQGLMIFGRDGDGYSSIETGSAS